MAAGSGMLLLQPAWPLWAATTAGRARFMAVSAVLTERADLDAEIGGLLYRALAARQEQAHPATSLDTRLERLTRALAAAPAPLAQDEQALAGDILRGWYLGIAGDDDNATLVCYEQALMFAALRGVLPPRSYCATRPGAWARPPLWAEVAP
jgi:hypothetical protein